jgi:HEAT repeat protein
MGIFGPPNIEKLKIKGNIKGLIKALAYKKFEQIREEAARALADIGVPATEPLILFFNAQDESLRKLRKTTKFDSLNDPYIKTEKAEIDRIKTHIIWTLGEIRDVRGVKFLIEVLKREERSHQKEVTEALRRITDNKSMELFILALKDEDADVRCFAAKSLGEIGDSKAVEHLNQALKDTKAKVRKEAAQSLGEIGDPRATESLCRALKDRTTGVRKEAAISLGKIGDSKAVECLCRALKDTKTKVRNETVISLGMIGDPEAAESLIAALEDEDPDVRSAALSALGKIGDPAVTEHLIEILCILEMMGDPKTQKLFINALKDKDRDARKRAAETLEEIGEREIKRLLGTPMNEETAVTLGKIGDLRAADIIIDWLSELASPPGLGAASMKPLFGGYTTLILGALGNRGECVISFPSSNRTEYTYTLNEMTDSIHRLTEIRTAISSNILHKVTRIRDIEVHMSSNDCDPISPEYYDTLSFASQREMAENELERRGNPPYDPSAYLDKSAWNL